MTIMKALWNQRQIKISPDLPLGVQGELLKKIYPKELSGDEKQHEPICIKQVERKRKSFENLQSLVSAAHGKRGESKYVNFVWCLFIEENVLHSTTQ